MSSLPPKPAITSRFDVPAKSSSPSVPTMVASCPSQVLVGGVGGAFTVTVNDAVAVLPASSVALHSTVVSPTGNTEPDAGSQEI